MRKYNLALFKLGLLEIHPARGFYALSIHPLGIIGAQKSYYRADVARLAYPAKGGLPGNKLLKRVKALEIFTMLPPSFRSGNAFCVTNNAPLKCTFTNELTHSSVISASMAWKFMPALLIKQSKRSVSKVSDKVVLPVQKGIEGSYVPSV